MLISIHLIYYRLSANECYLKGPNASFDLGGDGESCVGMSFHAGPEAGSAASGLQELVDPAAKGRRTEALRSSLCAFVPSQITVGHPLFEVETPSPVPLPAQSVPYGTFSFKKSVKTLALAGGVAVAQATSPSWALPLTPAASVLPSRPSLLQPTAFPLATQQTPAGGLPQSVWGHWPGILRAPALDH